MGGKWRVLVLEFVLGISVQYFSNSCLLPTFIFYIPFELSSGTSCKCKGCFSSDCRIFCLPSTCCSVLSLKRKFSCSFSLVWKWYLGMANKSKGSSGSKKHRNWEEGVSDFNLPSARSSYLLSTSAAVFFPHTYYLVSSKALSSSYSYKKQNVLQGFLHLFLPCVLSFSIRKLLSQPIFLDFYHLVVVQVNLFRLSIGS